MTESLTFQAMPAQKSPSLACQTGERND
jgi:hypothetical protein